MLLFTFVRLPTRFISEKLLATRPPSPPLPLIHPPLVSPLSAFLSDETEAGAEAARVRAACTQTPRSMFTVVALAALPGQEPVHPVQRGVTGVLTFNIPNHKEGGKGGLGAGAGVGDNVSMDGGLGDNEQVVEQRDLYVPDVWASPALLIVDVEVTECGLLDSADAILKSQVRVRFAVASVRPSRTRIRTDTLVHAPARHHDITTARVYALAYARTPTHAHARPRTPTHAHARPRTPTHAHARPRPPTHALKRVVVDQASANLRDGLRQTRLFQTMALSPMSEVDMDMGISILRNALIAVLEQVLLHDHMNTRAPHTPRLFLMPNPTTAPQRLCTNPPCDQMHRVTKCP